MRLLSFLALLFVNTAHAADFPVSTEDQKNIAAICTIAAKSPLTNDQQTAQIASWCVMWSNRMQAAERGAEQAKQPKPVEIKPDESK